MLKIIRGLFLGLVVLVGSACVTPTHASSASILITAVQAGSVDSARHELVVLYNPASDPVDITGWCLQNKVLVSFACFEETEDGRPFLPGNGHVVVAPEDYALAKELPNGASFTYTVTHQGSGSIVGSSDSIRLVDTSGETVDERAWASSLPTGSSWQRTVLADEPRLYADTGTEMDWQVGVVLLLPEHELSYLPIEVDPGTEEPEPVSAPGLYISELLPNPKGSDTGNEFIELYNADLDTPVMLDGYSLRVGSSLDKEYQFPEGTVLQPGEYRAFYNDAVKFTLVNSASAVQLVYDGEAVGDIVQYESTEEGRSWSLVGGEWVLGVPTPGAANEEYVGSPVTAVATQEESGLKPCAENQYRSPETNRCRKLETASASLTPCGPGQERNPETNRCRNIATTDSTPKPCAEGQERNPETNRCRKIVQMTTADHAVLAATEEKSSGLQWYAWAAMGGIVLAIIGYAVWEWRAELGQLGRTLKARFVPRSE